MESEFKLIARRVYRIGVQELKMDQEGNYYLSIKNRTYSNEIKLNERQTRRYKEAFNVH